MDLYAYAQIGDYEELLKANHIEVPRLRGIRLMSEERKLSEEEIRAMIKKAEVGVCEDLCRAAPFWDPHTSSHWYTDYSDYLINYFLREGPDGEKTIRWDRIHGKKRRILKFEIKKCKRRIRAQYEMWNRYAGVNAVAYIHSRIGGRNWDFYDGEELRKQPWFLGKVDDWFDRTYCDIYAKLLEQDVGVPDNT